jgi:hypothetical protein
MAQQDASIRVFVYVFVVSRGLDATDAALVQRVLALIAAGG